MHRVGGSGLGFDMEQRLLGRSGLSVPVLSLGTGTFGGKGDFFQAWGDTDVEGATRLVDVCLEHGLNLFDSADVYSSGAAEEILGRAVRGRRDRVLISTKCGFRTHPDANGLGTSRQHLTEAIHASLARLGVDHIDLFQVHCYDHATPPEETLRVLEQFIQAGKIRYIGCSNYSGWQLMKALAVSERDRLPRFVAHQAYYALSGRDYEQELMPLALSEGVGTICWSPLGWGRLTGKIRRGRPLPERSRLQSDTAREAGPPVDDGYIYDVVDALDAVAEETGRSVPQVALNWLLQRPTVSSLIVGARNEEQLTENLGAAGWSLTPQQVERLQRASDRPLAYPYWHQNFGVHGSVLFKPGR